jgi:hypothetical protein
MTPVDRAAFIEKQKRLFAWIERRADILGATVVDLVPLNGRENAWSSVTGPYFALQNAMELQNELLRTGAEVVLKKRATTRMRDISTNSYRTMCKPMVQFRVPGEF